MPESTPLFQAGAGSQVISDLAGSQIFDWNQTPAQKAGMLPGDVILKVNGGDVQSVSDVQSEVLRHRVGDNVKLILARKGQIYAAELEMMALPHRGDQVPQVY